MMRSRSRRWRGVDRGPSRRLSSVLAGDLPRDHPGEVLFEPARPGAGPGAGLPMGLDPTPNDEDLKESARLPGPHSSEAITQTQRRGEAVQAEFIQGVFGTIQLDGLTSE